MNIVGLMRPQSVGLMILFVYLPIIIRTGDWTYALIQIIPIYLLITGEIILNDYIDIEKDKINKAHRPLAAGKVSVLIAKRLIICLLVGATFSALIIYRESVFRMMLFAVVFVILTVYSVWMNYIASIKAFLTALATVLCLGFVFSYIGFERKILYLMIVAFLYISSRELLMDIRDYEGDKKWGCKTLAVQFGRRSIYWLSLLFMSLSQGLFLVFFVMQGDEIVLILWLISLAILLGAFVLFYLADSKNQNRIALALWIPMLLTIPSVIL